MTSKTEVNERIRAAFLEVCDDVYAPYTQGEPMPVSTYFRDGMTILLRREQGLGYTGRKKLWLIAAVVAALLLLTSGVLLVKQPDPNQGDHGTIVSRPEVFIATDFVITAPVEKLTERYVFSTVPEEFVEKTDEWRKDFSRLEWSQGTTTIRLEQRCSVTSERIERLTFSRVEPVTVNGMPAYLYRKKDTVQVKWVTENYQLCMRVSWRYSDRDIEPAQVLEWAESLIAEEVFWYEEPLPDDEYDDA